MSLYVIGSCQNANGTHRPPQGLMAISSSEKQRKLSKVSARKRSNNRSLDYALRVFATKDSTVSKASIKV